MRLLYVGDVPVESTYHGSALLHRLLSNYPHENLTVIETATQSDPVKRLPGVKYIGYQIGKARLLNTRLHPYAVAWFSQAGTRLAPKISQSVNEFNFEGVLTVAHGFGCLENEGVAEVVKNESDLAKAVARLATDPAMRVALGKRALDVGRQYFAHERVQQVFHRALCS